MILWVASRHNTNLVCNFHIVMISKFFFAGLLLSSYLITTISSTAFASHNLHFTPIQNVQVVSCDMKEWPYRRLLALIMFWSTSLALHSVFDIALIYISLTYCIFWHRLILACLHLGRGKKKTVINHMKR